MSDKRTGADPKIGAGTLQGMARQGLHELRNALYPESNVAAHTETGIYGTALPSEIAAQRHEDLKPGDAPSPSILDSRLKEADRQGGPSHDDHGREPPDIERE